MALDTRPAELDMSEGPDPWANFRVSNPHERLRLLRELCDGHVPVVLNLTDGTAVPTALWAVDTQTQRLTFSGDTGSVCLDRLVESNEAVAVAYLANIKLQFDVDTLMLVQGARHRALQSTLPAEIYRFQRRNAFRVRSGAQTGAVARFRHPGMPDMRLTLRVLDVSIGGCALWLPADVPPLPAGTRLGEVQMDLDAETRFSSPASLQHVTAVGSGERIGDGVRIGCEWQALPGASERVLQRWIDRAQQRQRLLAR
jgi:c-di-GMP-binding flagellar brake protein YcgR